MRAFKWSIHRKINALTLSFFFLVSRVAPRAVICLFCIQHFTVFLSLFLFCVLKCSQLTRRIKVKFTPWRRQCFTVFYLLCFSHTGSLCVSVDFSRCTCESLGRSEREQLQGDTKVAGREREQVDRWARRKRGQRREERQHAFGWLSVDVTS